MNEFEARIALLAVSGDLTMLVFLDQIIMGLQSDKPDVVLWAYESLTKYAAMRQKQIDAGTYKLVHDQRLKFLNWLSDALTENKTVINFSRN